MFEPNAHALDHVDDYLHEVLDAPDAAYVQRHCETCPICKAALEEAQRRVTAYQSIPPREASDWLIRSTLTRVATEPVRRSRVPKRFLRLVLPAAAIVAGVLGTAQWHYAHLAATPWDLKVFGQTELLAGTTGSLRIRLMDRHTGLPVEGAPVTVELRHRSGEVVQLASFNTNAQGTGQPRFRLPEWEDGSYELRVLATPSAEPETITQSVRLKRSWKLMLTSDKPVYQPGQVVHLRALTLQRADLKPVAEQAVTFAIADPKGNVIYKQQGTTSRFGIAATDCPLAVEIMEGPYQVTCRIGDTESKLTVDVQRYVLPKFRVRVELDQPFYQPGQVLRGTVQAEYFFGKPVAGGSVEIELQTTDVTSTTERREAVRTDAAGKATFELDLPRQLVGREQLSGDGRVSIQVTVRDTAGQQVVKSVPRIVTTQPLRVDVIPEAGTLVLGEPNRVYLFVTTPDGTPAPAQLLITGAEEAELRTNALGVASFELTPRAESVVLTIEARNAAGVRSRRTHSLTCDRVSQDFILRPNKAVYEAGETVHLVALGGGSAPIFVDFLKDGQTILTETIDMAGGTGTCQFDLPAELFGTLELCAYRIGTQALPVRKTRVLYVRRTSQLQVKATLDKAEYRPGGKARLQLRLTDAGGKPTPGAISLAGVDEAVFSVLRQAPGMEGRFYLLEQEMLQPIFALYPWAPDLTTSAPPEQRVPLEQALFARTAETSSEPAPIAPQRLLLPRGRQASVPPRSNRPAFSLVASSYPDKEQQVGKQRFDGLAAVRNGWLGLAGVLALAGYVLFWMVVRPLWLIFVMHGVAILFLAWVSFWSLWRVGSAVRLAEDAAFIRVGSNVVDAPAAAPRTESTPLPPGIAEPRHGAAAAVRVRESFPETLLWRPELITDDNGEASLDIELADSITTWRLTAGAVSADGHLGAVQTGLRVFQPFFVDVNLPVALTRGDEVAVPVVVYNYLDRPQTVDLRLEDGAWFNRLDAPQQHVDLAAGEVRSVSYRLRVVRVGSHHLQIVARGQGVADAVKRVVEVIPDGRRIETVVNGTLEQPRDFQLTVPPDAIEGSTRAILKIYPSGFSQLVEGLDAIFQLPYGCFEQTSSTTYPNVLALDYLKRTHRRSPEVEAKARQYIHLGYQRLMGFEVAGGGFDWYGRPPANVPLTAYGLMEFQDMAKVHDVDPALIARTRKWLLQQRNADGTWSASERGGQRFDMTAYGATAYIAWAVFQGQPASADAEPTRIYLLSHKPEQIPDAYALALGCNALFAVGASSDDVRPYLERLETLKRTSPDGKLAWWELDANGRTIFYGAGPSGHVETTALAVLACLEGNYNPATVRGALSWLITQKGPGGTWGSTQATVLALKALLAGTGKPLGGEHARHFELVIGDNQRQEIVLPADQADVVRQIDLTNQLRQGEQRVALREKTGTADCFQLVFRYYVPGPAAEKEQGPLAIDLSYDRTELKVNDRVTATATVRNRSDQTAPMVMLDLPIPAGFAVVADDFAKLVQDGTIAKYQVNPRTVLVYLRGLEPGQTLTLRYKLVATMPVKVSVPAAQVYEYYNPQKRASSLPARFAVERGTGKAYAL